MAISKRLRFEILRRDGFKCRYCHAHEALLTVDHVTPIALGGTDHPSNLVASCDECNSGKTSTVLGGTAIADISDPEAVWLRAVKLGALRATPAQSRDDRGHVHEAIVDTATLVWRSARLAVGTDPTTEPAARFRRDIDEYCAVNGPDDVLRIATTCGRFGIADLDEALNVARDYAGDERWKKEDALAYWCDRWAVSGGKPSPEQESVFWRHVEAARAAGYDGTSINAAAWDAGGSHDAALAGHLTTASEALRTNSEITASGGKF